MVPRGTYHIGVAVYTWRCRPGIDLAPRKAYIDSLVVAITLWGPATWVGLSCSSLRWQLSFPILMQLSESLLLLSYIATLLSMATTRKPLAKDWYALHTS